MRVIQDETTKVRPMSSIAICMQLPAPSAAPSPMFVQVICRGVDAGTRRDHTVD